MTFTFHKARLQVVKLSLCQLQEQWKSWCFAKLLDRPFDYFSVQCNGFILKSTLKAKKNRKCLHRTIDENKMTYISIVHIPRLPIKDQNIKLSI